MTDWAAGGRLSRRLVRDSLTAVSGRVALAALGFVGVLLTTRLLEPAEYGDLAVLLAVVMVLYALAASWSAAPMYTLVADERVETGSYSLTSSARLLLVHVALVPISLVTLVVGLVYSAERTTPLFVVAALVIAYGSIWCEHIATVLEAGGRYQRAAVVQLLRPLVYVVLLVGLLLFRPAAGLTTVLVMLMLSWGVALTFSLGLAAGAGTFFPLRTTRGTLAGVWRTSWPLILFSVSQLVFGTVDVFLLQVFTDSKAVGHYGLAYQCFAMGTVLSSALPALIAPRLTTARASGADPFVDYMRTVDRSVLPVLGALTGVLTVLVPILVPAIFGARFEEASRPLVMLCLALYLQFLAGWLGPILLVRSKTRVIGAVAAVAVLLNVTIDVLLLGPFHLGVLAPAIATTVACLCTAVAYTRYASALSRARLRNAPATLALVVLAVAATLLLDREWSLLVVAVGVVGLLAALRLTGRFQLPRFELPG